jgi:hypothetical protein
MIGFTDSDGTSLSGGTNYKISLPPNIPAANFWSVTLYDAENGSGSPMVNRFRRWAPAIDQNRMPMALRMFTSVPKLQRVTRATGSQQSQAKDTSLS